MTFQLPGLQAWFPRLLANMFVRLLVERLLMQGASAVMDQPPPPLRSQPLRFRPLSF